MSLVPLAPFLNSLGNDGFARPRPTIYAIRPQQFLYFFPLPHGHGSLRPTFGSSRRTVFTMSSPPTRAGWGPLARGGACVAVAADRGAPNTDAVADSLDGLFMMSGARRGAARRTCGASSLRIGRSHHRYRTISSSTRSFIAWNSAKLSFLYSTSGSR